MMLPKPTMLPAALALILMAAVPAAAQTQTPATATQSDVSVEADQMEFVDAERKAVFTGNVDARRRDIRLNSDVLTVFYKQKPAAAGQGAGQAQTGTAPAAGTTTAPAQGTAEGGQAAAPADPNQGSTNSMSGAQVTNLDAKGNVVIITAREKITGDWAKIDVAKDLLTVGGNVVLTQGSSVLRGQQLDVNLKTNRTVMTGGRVKGQFVPQ
jgi:lipopolysaccharide export system protein LptA